MWSGNKGVYKIKVMNKLYIFKRNEHPTKCLKNMLIYISSEASNDLIKIDHFYRKHYIKVNTVQHFSA